MNYTTKFPPLFTKRETDHYTTAPHPTTTAPHAALRCVAPHLTALNRTTPHHTTPQRFPPGARQMNTAVRAVLPFLSGSTNGPKSASRW